MWQVITNLGDRLTSIAAAQNADGRIEAFGTGPDNTIWHAWQTAPSTNQWSPWEMRGNPDDLLVTIAAASNADGRLELFGTAADNTIWHAWQTAANANQWSGWEMRGNPDDLLATIAVARNLDGRLDAVGTAPDNTVWHSRQTAPNSNQWSDWQRLSKLSYRFVSIAATSNEDGRLEAFGTVPDDTIWHNVQTSPGVWTPDPPDNPGSPNFEDVTDTSVIILAGPLPDAATSLDLQREENGNFITRYSNAVGRTNVRNLIPGTRYVFRLVASGPGGNVVGNSASVTTLARVIVPNIVGMLLSEGTSRLREVNLKIGETGNPTGEIYEDKLRIAEQAPQAGTEVVAKSRVNVQVVLAQAPPTQGVRRLNLFNCNTDGRTINIWMRDSSTQTWTQMGQLATQYDSGVCPAPGATPFVLNFQSNRAYVVVAVDTGNVNCGENNPENQNCRRYTRNIIGDANGAVVEDRIA